MRKGRHRKGEVARDIGYDAITAFVRQINQFLYGDSGLRRSERRRLRKWKRLKRLLSYLTQAKRRLRKAFACLKGYHPDFYD